MITVPDWHFKFNVKRFLARLMVVGLISISSILLGLIPTLQSPKTRIVFSNAAYADDVSDQEIQEYARSVLALEPIRQRTYTQIKRKIGYVPKIACDQPSSLNDLDSSIQQEAIDYCNQAIAIVESNNLSITRFNAITIAHKSDPDLLSRIQKALQQLQ